MGLLRSTATVGGLTMISRVLGFIRDVVIARVFGAGLGTDAFFVAFKIPNFMRRLFAEGAFSQAFVPVLSEYKAQRPVAEVRVLIADAAGTLGGVLTLLSVAGMLGAPLLVMLFAPGFVGEGEKFALTSELLRITFPYILFISMAALVGGVLNTYSRFAVPAITPVWLNVILIAAALWAAPYFAQPIEALAWGVFLAGLVQLGFQLPAVARLGLLARPRWGWRDPGVRRILKLMLPAIFGSSVAQVNLLVDTIIASFLVTGSVSWLYYSDRLVEFPLGVFGVALGTVILPNLSRQHAEAAPEDFARTLDWAVRWVLLIGVPATLGLALLAGPMLVTLFHYGAFTDEDARMATLSLVTFSLGLVAFMLVKVLAPGFYARQDTRTPVRFGVYAVVFNMAFNLAVIVPLAMRGVSGLHAGLALATSLAAYLNVGLLFRRLRADRVWRASPGWGLFALRAVLANLAMAAVLWFASGTLADWLTLGALDRALWLAGLIGAGALVYGITLLALGMRLSELRGRRP
ncbi:MAG: murein biosynthesis integral membrane protein MurJ [Gammaproteobacteria bacterium]|nr:murein biosynthesis integral membrane protein MurJ [Gammaproteobacteria bacterium]